MKTKPLGRLTKTDLREYWKREGTHFTPWLARGLGVADGANHLALRKPKRGITCWFKFARWQQCQTV